MKSEKHNILIVPYRDYHKEDIVSIYRSAFSHPPWNEYKICTNCETKHGIEDAYDGVCNNCNGKLVDFWPKEKIISGLEKSIDRSYSKVLLAKKKNKILGFVYGFRGIPEGNYSCLEKKIPPDSFYINELAVCPQNHRIGIGTRLLNEIILKSKENHNLIYLRTDPQNDSAMNLYQKAGFVPINYKDPYFSKRIYLIKEL